MPCPRCQTQNDPGARFCEDCGARLEMACPSCGALVTAGKKFCRSCGTPLTPEPTRFGSLESYTPKHLAEKILTSKAALEGERKQVSVLFADLKGSMELLADRDPEEARKILDPVLERMMEAVHRYEGTVNQVMGDGIMALRGRRSPTRTTPSPPRRVRTPAPDVPWAAAAQGAPHFVVRSPPGDVPR
jgi:Double zinc ribbon/Adenylate and Guanylate cyclase catalytic domain